MNDWWARANFGRREMMNVAGAILGLLAACVLVLWVLTRFLHRREVPQPPPPAAKPAPATEPRPAQQG